MRKIHYREPHTDGFSLNAVISGQIPIIPLYRALTCNYLTRPPAQAYMGAIILTRSDPPTGKLLQKLSRIRRGLMRKLFVLFLRQKHECPRASN